MENLILIVGALVAVTNIVVEVIKKLTWNKIPTNLLVVVVSVVLTMASFYAYVTIKAFPFMWYHVGTAIVVSFFVAYAAMFGFDKLKEALKEIKHE